MSDSATNINKNKGAGFAITALILGIVAILSSFIPLAGIFLVWAPAIVGLILGIIGLTGGRPSRVMALVGVILSGLSIILVIVFTSVALGAVSSAIDETTSSTESSEVSEDSTGASEFVYEVTGDGGSAMITYASYSDGEYSSQSANGAALPFSYTGTLADGGILDFSSLSLVAIGTDTTTTLSCKITVDGEVVSENTSTGAYASVMCSQSDTGF